MAEQILYTVGNKTTSDGSSYKGAEWYFSYTTEVISNGKTRVKWGLYKRGRESSPTRLSTTIELYITSDYNIAAENGAVLTYKPSRFSTSPNSDGTNHPHCSYKSSLNTTPTKSGSFIITHGTDGKGSFKVQLKAAIYSKTLSDGGVKTISLNINMPYTNCHWSSNATISINPTCIIPGQNFTISWTGANAGTGLEISSYKVWYKIDNGSWTAVQNNPTTASCTISANTDTFKNNRGKDFQVKIQIISSVSNYNSTEKTSSIFKINTKPPNPIITSQGYVTNGTSSAKFTVNRGSDIEGHTITTYYNTNTIVKTDQSVSGTELVKTLAEGQKISYYFCNYDGFEYSEWVGPYTIGRNHKQTVGISWISGTDNPFATFTVQGSTETLGDISYTYKIGDKIYTPGTDIRPYLTLIQDKITTYTVTVTKTDGIDTVEDSCECSYHTPKIELEGLDNNGRSVSNDVLKSYFNKKLKIIINSQESYYNSVRLEVQSSFSSISNGSTIIETDTVSAGYIVKTLVFSYGEKKFNVSLDNTSNNQVKNKIKQLPNTLLAYVDINGANKTYKPYTSDGISLQGRIPSDGWAPYGISDAPQLVVKINSKEYGIVSTSSESSNNTVNCWLSGENIWECLKELPKYSLFTTLTYGYTNDFGEEYTSHQSIKISLDYKEKAEFSLTDGGWLYPGIDLPVINAWEFLKEKMPLYTNCIVDAYSIPTAILEYQIVGETTWREFGASIVGIPTNVSASVSYKSPISYSFTDVFGNIEKITSNHSRYFRLKIITDGDQSLSQEDTQPYLFKAHQQPKVSFTTIEYNTNTKKIDFEITTELTEGTVFKTLKFNQKDKGADIDIYEFENNELMGSVECIFDDKIDMIQIAPELTTILTTSYTKNGVTTSGFFQTEYTTAPKDCVYVNIYNISPTVSYRKNYLGINTNALSDNENAVLVINGYNSRQQIQLRKSDGQIFYVDLETGSINNFIIDAGSWDGASGEIIPGTGGGSGQIPTGLAAIAYSGEVGDLQQTRNDIIIISGGSAPTTEEI